MGFAELVIGPATSGRTRWLYPSNALSTQRNPRRRFRVNVKARNPTSEAQLRI
jgi:hypothetical protein